MIKYKHAKSEGWYYKIDTTTGQKISFDKKHGLYNEMIKSGKKIEAQYTAKEKAAKDKKESDLAAVAWLENREAEYPTPKELVVALWERVVENRAEASEALEIKRQAVKLKHPQPK